MGGRANLVAGIDRQRQTGFKMEKMFRLVMKAIQLFGPGGGATASQIANYIQSAHRVPLTSKDLKEGVKDSLKKGIAGGVLRRRNVDGKYYVCPRTASINPNRLPITKILRRVVPAAPPSFRQQRHVFPPDFPVRQPRMRNQIPEMPKPPRLPKEVKTSRKVKEKLPLSPLMKASIGHTPLPDRKKKHGLIPLQQNPKLLNNRKERKEKKIPRSPLKRRETGLLRRQPIRSPRRGDVHPKETPDANGRESKNKSRGRPKRLSLTRKTNPANPTSRPTAGATAKSPTKSEKSKKPDAPTVPTPESTSQASNEKPKPKN